MNSAFLNFLFPTCLLILQTFLLMILWINVLKKMKVLRMPIGGMEYGHLILSASLIFGGMVISTSNAEPLFQSFKVFSNLKHDMNINTFNKFTQYFVVILFMQILFALLSVFVIKVIYGFKNTKTEIEEGNIIPAILVGAFIIPIAMIVTVISSEMVSYWVPQIYDIR